MSGEIERILEVVANQLAQVVPGLERQRDILVTVGERLARLEEEVKLRLRSVEDRLAAVQQKLAEGDNAFEHLRQRVHLLEERMRVAETSARDRGSRGWDLAKAVLTAGLSIAAAVVTTLLLGRRP